MIFGRYKKILVHGSKMRFFFSGWRAGEITATEAMKRVGLKPNTFCRRVKDMGF
jgi:hypothetical protein